MLYPLKVNIPITDLLAWFASVFLFDLVLDGPCSARTGSNPYPSGERTQWQKGRQTIDDIFTL